jgi:hypothetical protein
MMVEDLDRPACLGMFTKLTRADDGGGPGQAGLFGDVRLIFERERFGQEHQALVLCAVLVKFVA